MVAHILRSAALGRLVAREENNPAAETPPDPPRRTARDILLHNHRLAELATGEAVLLVDARSRDRVHHRLQAEGGRHEVGPEDLLKRRRR